MPPANLPELHSIDLTNPDLTIRSGHLRMGGRNPDGHEIYANSRYLTFDGQPWTPVMGELHFTRCSRRSWRDELSKMKAGGIQVVATYLFWNHHEEKEGQFLWSGNRDLRAFVSLCAETGLFAYPRIGPWAHGEVRLGGFPDWLVEKCGSQVRRDAQPYLDYAKIYYQQISTQLQGLLWKDGGPVIGLQLENELADQPGHILTLKRLAQAVGLDVPLYTMTGWGPAQVPQDEVIPVFGGYPDAPWDRHHDDWSRPSRKHYFFSPIRDDNAIGADLGHRPGAPDLSYLERYPYGTCELGGGVQGTYHRRPALDPQDISSVPFCKLGSGANLLGYYMYHGGTNPIGERSTLQEDQASGYPNDLPVRSYDFQGPIGEAGSLRPHYHQLRLLHLFVQDFGSQLAPLAPVFPADAPTDLDDRDKLRWAVRTDGEQAFIFSNNYQRIESLGAHTGVQFELGLKGETLRLPSQPFDLPTGARLLWPVNLDLGDLRLKYASANLLCRLEGSDIPTFVFSACAGIASEFAFEMQEKPLEITCQTGRSNQRPGILIHTLEDLKTEVMLEVNDGDRVAARILLIPGSMADQLWKAQIWGQERLFLSSGALLFEPETLRLRASRSEDLQISVFPAPKELSEDGSRPLQRTKAGLFERFSIARQLPEIGLDAQRLRPADLGSPVRIGPAGVAQAPAPEAYAAGEHWLVTFKDRPGPGTSRTTLVVRYTGDAACAYLEDELVSDNFYCGHDWEIGLGDLDPAVWERGLDLAFLPLRKDAPIYIPPEYLPAFDENGQALHLQNIAVHCEIEARIRPL